MAINSIYKVAIVARGPNGDHYVNTLYYRAVSGTIFDAQAQDLAEAMAASDAMQIYYPAICTNGLKLEHIEVRGITDETEGYDLSFDPEPIGAVTGEMLPPSVAGVITFTTGKVGRRYRGRNYLFPTGESQQSGGFWTASYPEGMANYADALKFIGDGVSYAQYRQCVWSRTYLVATDVTDKVVRIDTKTQRRRRPGAGS